MGQPSSVGPCRRRAHRRRPSRHTWSSRGRLRAWSSRPSRMAVAGRANSHGLGRRKRSGKWHKPVAAHAGFLGVAAEMDLAGPQPLRRTGSPALNSGCWDASTVPAKPIPGTIGNRRASWGDHLCRRRAPARFGGNAGLITCLGPRTHRPLQGTRLHSHRRCPSHREHGQGQPSGVEGNAHARTRRDAECLLAVASGRPGAGSRRGEKPD